MLTRQGAHFVPRRSRHFWTLALLLVLGVGFGAAAVAGGRDQAGNEPVRVVAPTTSSSTTTTTEPAPSSTEPETTDVSSPATGAVADSGGGSAPVTSRAKKPAASTAPAKPAAPARTSTPTTRATTTTSPYWPWGCYPFCEFDD